MTQSEEEEGIRIFSWTAHGAPVVEEVAPPPTRGARWKPGDSDEEEEEWRSRALDVAVDAEKIRAQAPMLQARPHAFSKVMTEVCSLLSSVCARKGTILQVGFNFPQKKDVRESPCAAGGIPEAATS